MNVIARSVCLMVAMGSFWTGMMISGALTILQEKAIINAKTEVYLQLPLDELVMVSI